MHMLRTCVSTMSSIRAQNLPRNKMARSIAHLAGQYVGNNARTHDMFTDGARLFRGQGLPHLAHLHICKVPYDVLLKACPLCQGTVAVHMRCTQLISV